MGLMGLMGLMGPMGLMNWSVGYQGSQQVVGDHSAFG